MHRCSTFQVLISTQMKLESDAQYLNNWMMLMSSIITSTVHEKNTIMILHCYLNFESFVGELLKIESSNLLNHTPLLISSRRGILHVLSNAQVCKMRKIVTNFSIVNYMQIWMMSGNFQFRQLQSMMLQLVTFSWNMSEIMSHL